MASAIFLSLYKFNRVLKSGIIASTILFNNESRFDNLSEPLVIHLSHSKKVWSDLVAWYW